MVAREQGRSHLPFERAHHVAHARLRVPEQLGRLLEAARFRHGDEGLVLLVAHGSPFEGEGCAARFRFLRWDELRRSRR